MASVAVTKAEHDVFTNAWRAAIPLGHGTANATRQQVLDAARQIYAGHPELLRALGLWSCSSCESSTMSRSRRIPESNVSWHGSES